MAATIRTEGLVDRERLKETLTLLREHAGRGITKAQLAKRLGGVSQRTVDRAVGLLEAQGARIDRQRQGRPAVIHFFLQKGPAWDEHVSSGARLALRLAARVLAQSGTLLWEEDIQALEALASEHMSSRDRRLFEQLQGALRVQGGVEDPVEDPDVLEPVLRALEGSKELEVDYQAPGRPRSTRTVVPYALTHDLFSGGAFLLVWDGHRRMPLHLRLSRICGAKVLARTGVIPDPRVMEAAATTQIGGWISADAPFEVRARVRGAAWVQALKEAPPNLPAFEGRPSRDGVSMELSFRASHPNGALRWLLQFGDALEVLEPAGLRETMRRSLENALERYR